MIEIIEEVLRDSLPMLPILFLAYLFIEWYEHRSGDNTKLYRLLEKYGPLFGAAFGIVPQCGFSIIAGTLFVEKKISLGTLISVLIATSDEALPILIANPSIASKVIEFILIKLVVAVIVGYLVDIIFSKYKFYRGTYNKKEIDHDHHHSISKTAFVRTIKIFLFIIVVNFALTTLISIVGEVAISSILLEGSVLQPIIASIFGFIPNCISSVVLAQFYVQGVLSFSSLMAGLITNAGLGLMVLLNYKVEKKTMGLICLILFVSAMVTGGILSLF